VPGALLADRELSREPARITIVGAKDDPAAQALYATARQYPTRYLRIEWLDRREGPLPAADVEYPELPEAAAFACANGACSVPVFASGQGLAHRRQGRRPLAAPNNLQSGVRTVRDRPATGWCRIPGLRSQNPYGIGIRGVDIGIGRRPCRSCLGALASPGVGGHIAAKPGIPVSRPH
jgi:hypothetical protein